MTGSYSNTPPYHIGLGEQVTISSFTCTYMADNYNHTRAGDGNDTHLFCD
jgi:hypothetical protein